jgi:hypothetical protein
MQKRVQSSRRASRRAWIGAGLVAACLAARPGPSEGRRRRRRRRRPRSGQASRSRRARTGLAAAPPARRPVPGRQKGGGDGGGSSAHIRPRLTRPTPPQLPTPEAPSTIASVSPSVAPQSLNFNLSSPVKPIGLTPLQASSMAMNPVQRFIASSMRAATVSQDAITRIFQKLQMRNTQKLKVLL